MMCESVRQPGQIAEREGCPSEGCPFQRESAILHEQFHCKTLVTSASFELKRKYVELRMALKVSHPHN